MMFISTTITALVTESLACRASQASPNFKHE